MEPDSVSSRWWRRLRSAGVVPAVAVLILAGCAAPDTASAPADDAPPADTSTGTSSDDESTAESVEPADDGEVVVEGEELVEDSLIVITAETYASGRTPQPRVTFTAPLEVTFTYPGTLEATTQIADCAIAFGVLDPLGVVVTFVDDAGTFDCSAEYGS